MAQPARQHEPTDVQLTIVPWESFEEPTPEAKPAASQPKPAPRKPRTGLLVAGALGGGMMMGGGAVGLLSLLLAAVAVAGAGVVALFFWASAPIEAVEPVAEVEPVVAEVEAPVVVEEAEEDVEPEPVAAAPRPTPMPAPARTAPPPPPAPAPAPAEPAVLPDTVVVKVLTDPPAALLRVDGADAGRSPAKLTLEPGSYQLTIESGKASGTFPIDAGLDTDRYCFEARGKKLDMVACS